jgi:hypothetical protein
MGPAIDILCGGCGRKLGCVPGMLAWDRDSTAPGEGLRLDFLIANRPSQRRVLSWGAVLGAKDAPVVVRCHPRCGRLHRIPQERFRAVAESFRRNDGSWTMTGQRVVLMVGDGKAAERRGGRSL